MNRSTRQIGAVPNALRGRQLLTVVTAVSLLVACGEDTDDPGDLGDGSANSVDTFCEASVEAYQLNATSPDTDDLEDGRAHARKILPVAEKLAASAPSAVQPQVDQMLATTRAVAESGDLSGFQSPDFATAESRWHSAGLETCDWNTIDVRLADHAFSGLPDTLDAGVASIEMSNIGTEFHVIAIFRRNGDIDDTIQNLLAQPTDDGFAGLTAIASGFAAPGSTGYVLTTLTPGEYVAICPIPIGATPGSEPLPNAMPHYNHGMLHEFTVP